MDSGEDDHIGESIVEIQDSSVNQLSSSDSPDVDVIFGNPQVLCRVGDQYQAEIPPFETESDLHLVKNPADQDFTVDINDPFLMGLPIPIMWIHDRPDNIKNELLEGLGVPDGAERKNGPIQFQVCKESNSNVTSEDSKVKLEHVGFISDGGMGLVGSTEIGIQNNVSFTSRQHEELKIEKPGCYPAPGSLSSSWSDFEQASFVLGLFIFGKNLNQVKKFVGIKEMGDILSFYYGIFYRSDGYRRWSQSRKVRSRRCIHGHRLFTGWRQQELLSRLLPHVSEECKDTLIEVSRRFGDGKINLEDYVWTIKDKVGLELFIEAVGIGKRKKDLTRMVSEPPKSNQASYMRLEVPVGRACSSLTSGEIIRFLTGDFRLGKARSNDLFWEAVWPRLLAKGWRSEQPKNKGYVCSKGSLVFLIPGIKKFSRRKLEKGNHYFDCPSDVLKKVASDPELIELEAETPNGTIGDEEYDDDNNDNNRTDDQRKRFLQPPGFNSNVELMKFTVVDTSLVRGEPLTVRKLKNLPVTTTKGTAPRTPRVYEAANPILSVDHQIVPETMELCSDGTGCSVEVLEQGIPLNENDLEPINTVMECLKNDDISIPDENLEKIISLDKKQDDMSTTTVKNPSKLIKCQFSRRRKRGQSNTTAPVTKRRRLTACSHDDASRNKEFVSHLYSIHGSDGMVSEPSPSQEKLSTTPVDSIDDVVDEKKGAPCDLIDLNLPHLSADNESENCITKLETGSSSELPSGAVARRQSTRNRPLTAKALEALACGFLTTKRKWRGTEPTSDDNWTPKSSRRNREKVRVTVSTSTVDSKDKQGLTDESSSEDSDDTHTIYGPQFLTERVA
ncbi:hypothetical protein ACHQM5_015074 [Ranunculus cassubicifolius]